MPKTSTERSREFRARKKAEELKVQKRRRQWRESKQRSRARARMNNHSTMSNAIPSGMPIGTPGKTTSEQLALMNLQQLHRLEQQEAKLALEGPEMVQKMVSESHKKLKELRNVAQQRCLVPIQLTYGHGSEALPSVDHGRNFQFDRWSFQNDQTFTDLFQSWVAYMMSLPAQELKLCDAEVQQMTMRFLAFCVQMNESFLLKGLSTLDDGTAKAFLEHFQLIAQKLTKEARVISSFDDVIKFLKEWYFQRFAKDCEVENRKIDDNGLLCITKVRILGYNGLSKSYEVGVYETQNVKDSDMSCLQLPLSYFQ